MKKNISIFLLVSFLLAFIIAPLSVSAYEVIGSDTTYVDYLAYGGTFSNGSNIYYMSHSSQLIKMDPNDAVLNEKVNFGQGVPKPTRKGYDFNGWYYWSYFSRDRSDTDVLKAANGTIDLNTLRLMGPFSTQNVILSYATSKNGSHTFGIASWKIHNYNIVYHYNDTTSTEQNPYQQDYTISTAFVPQKEGYTFVGWDTSIEGTNVVYKPGDTCTTDADLNLYPVWEKATYTINYDANGGLEAPKTQYTQIDDGMTIPFATPYRGGYNFAGWSKSATAIKADYQPGDLLPNEHLNLYALWNPAIPENGAAVSGQDAFEGNNTIYEDIYVNLSDNPTYICIDLSYPSFIEYDSYEPVDIADEITIYENTSGNKHILNISIYNQDGIAVNNLTQLGRLYFNVMDVEEFGSYKMSINQNSSFYMINNQKVSVDYVKNQSLELKPYTAKEIEITGKDTITKPTQYSVNFTPANTAIKTVEWSVDDESIATIDADGILTPLKNGTVTLSATTVDGSNLTAHFVVEITNQPATITNLSTSVGRFTTTFEPHQYVYTLLVPTDCESIELTASFAGGTLLCDSYGNMFSDIAKTIYINSDEQELVLTKQEQNLTDANYFITIKKTDNVYGLLGDVDNDLYVSVLDATYIQRMLGKLDLGVEINKDAADVNGDNSISVLDATLIQRWVVQLPSNDNIGKPITK